MLRGEHAVAVQQQHRHAHELLDLHQRLFIVLVAFVLWLRGGQPGEVGQGFLPLLGKLLPVAGRQAEGAEKAPAPLEQGPAALGQRRLGVGQKQGEVASSNRRLSASIADRAGSSAGMASVLDTGGPQSG